MTVGAAAPAGAAVAHGRGGYSARVVPPAKVVPTLRQ
jgi:hypothetical protein